MKVSPSAKAAGLIVAVIAAYFGARAAFRGDGADGAEVGESKLFPVIAQTVSPQTWQDEIVIRGRTKAERKVILRAETPGAVAETPATLGALVAEGDVICKLRVDARRAQLKEARAARDRAKLDYDAAVKLNREGFRAETAVAAARAALDLAKANLEQAELNLEKTEIRAPFDGVFEKRMAEVGDYLGIGDPCGVVIQRSPFLVVGAVSEQEVAKIAVGDRGAARLATGEVLQGEVRFVAKSADPLTRTFDAELEVPNEDGALRDGVTAEFTVYAARRQAHRVPRSALTLDDEGVVGVRLLDGGDTVRFANVTLLGEGREGVWVGGLEGDVRLITRGQDFVSPGQKVAVTERKTES
ncbi:MAG: efflux RND transporter periplasmic adaptor subunit [Parvularculaceae bacterium]